MHVTMGPVVLHLLFLLVLLPELVRADTTTTSITTTTLSSQFAELGNEYFYELSAGDCGSGTVPEGSPLSWLPRGGRLLLTGDSITTGAQSIETLGQGAFLVALLQRTYQRYCEGDISLSVDALSGKPTYQPQRGGNSRLENAIAAVNPHLVIAQDAGGARDLSDDPEIEVNRRSFDYQVYHAVPGALSEPLVESSPRFCVADDVTPCTSDAQCATLAGNCETTLGFCVADGVTPCTSAEQCAAVVGNCETTYRGGIVMTTTPPFEDLKGLRSENKENCQLYAKECNWVGHNRVLAEYAVAHPSIRLAVADIGDDICAIYAELAKTAGTPVYVTQDGIHPLKIGKLAYGLSLFKRLGGSKNEATLARVVEAADAVCTGTCPSPGEIETVYDLVFRDSAMPSGPCLLNPTCPGGSANFAYLDYAEHCMDFCADPAHACRPYFGCQYVGDNPAPCEDQFQCTGSDTCASRTCSEHQTQPCEAPRTSCVTTTCTEADPGVTCGFSLDASTKACECDLSDPCIESCGENKCDGAGACGVAGYCPVCSGPSPDCKSLGDVNLRLESQIVVNEATADGSVALTAKHGDATDFSEFGDVGDLGDVDTDAFTVCIYAENGELLWYGAMPENECGVSTASSCWDRHEMNGGRGRLKYQNRSDEYPNARDIKRVDVKFDPQRDQTRFTLRASGPNTAVAQNLAGVPDTEIDRSFTVQVVNSFGSGCWQADVVGVANHSSDSGLSSYSGVTP